MCREDTRQLQPIFFLQRDVAEGNCSVPLSQSKLLLISHVPAQLPPQPGSLHQHPKVEDQGLRERELELLPFLPFILAFCQEGLLQKWTFIKIPLFLFFHQSFSLSTPEVFVACHNFLIKREPGFTSLGLKFYD